MRYGISLAHLASLPVSHDQSFQAACEYVKQLTVGLKGYRSYACWLRDNPETKHLVRDQATVFVSYAWCGSFGRTMHALKEHCNNDLDEIFVWMDFAILDQHVTTDANFHDWIKVFKSTIREIGTAVLVLTPGENPFAISRSWCCFEWLIIVQSNIPYAYCVLAEEEQKLIRRMQDGLEFTDSLAKFFSSYTVEKVRALKEGEQKAILAHMQEVGIDEVNDIIKTVLKRWFLKVAIKAVQDATENTTQMVWALNSRARLHHTLGELDKGLPFYEKALLCSKSIPNNDVCIAAQFESLGLAMMAKANLAAAESSYREALSIKKKALGENHPEVATTLNFIALVLSRKEENDDAEHVARAALAINKAAFGDNHHHVAKSLQTLGRILQDQGEIVQARRCLEKSLEICRNTFGNEHPEVADALYSLARLERQAGNRKRALELGKQVLTISENTPGVSRSTHWLIAKLVKECE